MTKYLTPAILLLFSSIGIFAQTTPTPSPEMQQVLELLKAQQARMDALQATVDAQQRKLDQLEGRAPSTTAVVPAAAVPAAANPPATTPAKPPVVAVVNGPVAPPANAAVATTMPLQLKIGDTSIIPVGFMDLTNTFRSTNAGTSLQSNFASIPYNNVVAGRLSEDKLTAANSRIGFRVDTKVKGTNVLGYFEGDFLGGIGNASFNTQVTSNSLLYRIRLYWVDLRKNKWEMLAGQSWSMMVPNRKQISALPADLFYGQVVDANYLNGLPWGRTPGARVLYHPSEKLTMAVGVENSTQYFGGSGGAGVPAVPSALAPLIGGELDMGSANDVGTPNVRPDILAKIAWDPSPKGHLEVTGLTSAFRLFNPITGEHFRATGAAGAVNGNIEVFRNLRLFSNNFWGNGEGRYLFGVAPDFIVRADGSLSLVHSGSTASGLEYQRGNSLWYTYYGGIYVGRNTTPDSNGRSLVGYGFPGSPLSHNRATQEATAGMTQTFWRDARIGALQAMVQYAYLTRSPWDTPPGGPKGAHENVVYFNLRFTLPGGPPPVTR
jgi:hypothetical protein